MGTSSKITWGRDWARIIGALLYYVGGVAQGLILGVVIGGYLRPFPIGWQLTCILFATLVAVCGELIMECERN